MGEEQSRNYFPIWNRGKPRVAGVERSEPPGPTAEATGGSLRSTPATLHARKREVIACLFLTMFQAPFPRCRPSGNGPLMRGSRLWHGNRAARFLRVLDDLFRRMGAKRLFSMPAHTA